MNNMTPGEFRAETQKVKARMATQAKLTKEAEVNRSAFWLSVGTVVVVALIALTMI
jgi:hypothetical protein